jgi:hypothetical protein
LDCLQYASVKGAICLCCVWERLEKAGKGQIFFFSLSTNEQAKLQDEVSEMKSAVSASIILMNL